MILHDTDRTVRVYSWFTSILNATPVSTNHLGSSSLFTESGRFILEHSWELTEQVGFKHSFSINLEGLENSKLKFFQICSINIIKDFLNNKDIIATSPGGKVILCKFMQITLDNVKVELSNSSSSLTSLSDTTFNNQSGVSAKSTNYVNIVEEVMHGIQLVVVDEFPYKNQFQDLIHLFGMNYYNSVKIGNSLLSLRLYFIKDIKFKLKKNEGSKFPSGFMCQRRSSS